MKRKQILIKSLIEKRLTQILQYGLMGKDLLNHVLTLNDQALLVVKENKIEITDTVRHYVEIYVNEFIINSLNKYFKAL